MIDVVEAAYDLGATETEWLQGVADSFFQVLRPEHGLLAYHVEVDSQGFHIRTPVQAGSPPMDMVERIHSMGMLMAAGRNEQAEPSERANGRAFERVLRAALRESSLTDRLLLSEYQRVGPDSMYTLGAPVEDTFAFFNHHVDSNDVTAVFGGLKKQRTLRPTEREMYMMLGVHMKAGLRLRRRLPRLAPSVQAPDDGAVLSGSGRVIHAEGEARAAENRAELTAAAQRIDRARSRKSGRDEHALAAWQGLIHGHWSLVETFDIDGKRYILAHRNPEDVRDPRGLSTMEARVVSLAVRGYSDKLIAYHLGVSEGTVSSHLTHALRKLRISGRVELVRLLGTRYPSEGS